ncbi:hypothetical protein HRbin19_00599 [bacterium HR19]|nr:hypothetical protein HRbin19_00599 [bacterium HR19]
MHINHRRSFTDTIALALSKCAGKSGSGSSSDGSSSQQIVATNFKSPEDAYSKISGSANSILTARILTARTSPSGGSSGGTMSAPQIVDIISKLPYTKKLSLTKRLFAKHESDLSCEVSSCEELEPQCESGSAKLESCNKQGNKITAVVSANNCKTENMVISGKATFIEECKEYNIPETTIALPQYSVTFENAKIEIYQENQKIYEYEFSPKFSISVILSASSYQNDGASISTSLNLSGNSIERDLKQNIEQKVVMDNFTGILNFSYDENSGDSLSFGEFSLSFSGKYSISTNPKWCGDGGFEVSTPEPLKFSFEQENGNQVCPKQGKLRINNSEVRFDGNSVKISVDGQEKTLTCDEFLNSCPYPLKGPLQAISEM